MSINASISVQFSDGTDSETAAKAGAYLSAEIDKRETGPNSGKTSFAPGDTVGFLVYKSDNVTLSAPVASAGSVSMGRTVNVEQEADLTFANNHEARLRVAPQGGFLETKWIGNNLGSISINGQKATVSKSSIESQKVGVAKVKYVAQATTGTITAPVEVNGETSFSIVVLIVGTITDT